MIKSGKIRGSDALKVRRSPRSQRDTDLLGFSTQNEAGGWSPCCNFDMVIPCYC